MKSLPALSALGRMVSGIQALTEVDINLLLSVEIDPQLRAAAQYASRGGSASYRQH